MDVYKLKSEFFPKYGITAYSWNERKSELKMWLSNFFDYEINELDNPITIRIYEQYGEYKPLPRKVSETNKEEKIRDYEEFTIAALGTEFKPNSKARVARQAIEEFSYEKYGHTNEKAVAKRFVSPAFEKYGETEGPHIWVWHSNYTEPKPEVVENWRSILRKYRVGEAEAANAFYRQEQGEDVTEEKNAFKNAKDEFFGIHGDYVVLVKKWRRNKEKAE